MNTTLNGDFTQMSNMLFMPLMMTLMSTITVFVTEMVKQGITHLSAWFLLLIVKIKSYIPYFKKYTITISYNEQTCQDNENNKLLINAILYNYNQGINYKISNKQIVKNGGTEYHRENNRQLILSVLDRFIEDGINVTYEKVTKAITIDGKNSDCVEDVVILESNKSIDHIKNYIKNKRTIYVKQFCKIDDNPHIYVPLQYGVHNVAFQKTKLKSKKSFKTWFCSKKPDILKLIHNFTNKKGSYQLSTSVYKLGFLLYGVPGAGRTTFIKSLAKEMNRSIITISLEKITSVASFMKLFTAPYILANGNNGSGDIYTYLAIKNRILVFEDIDTAGSIVKTRTDYKVEDVKKDKIEIKNVLVLGDILNALDGICEATGLVYVMTTNHIEKLDPALIRPGRITYALELKELNKDELLEMFNYYYIENNVYEENLSMHEKLQLIDQIATYLQDKYTASKIENYCNQYNLIQFHVHMKSL